MIKLYCKYILLAFILFQAEPVHSQRMAERMHIFNPLFNETNHVPENETKWINSVSGWGEFGGYLYSQDESHAWYQKLGGFFEFFRISDKNSLSALSNIEFIADPNNDIKFNPRAIFWEEAILYSSRAGEGYWQAGYYHRCKHDIDNLDIGYERSLIYGSLLTRYTHPVIQNERTVAYGSLKGDLYTILQDYRKPASNGLSEPVTGDLSFSAALNFNIKQLISSMAGIYLSSFTQFNFYSSSRGIFKKMFTIDNVNINGGAETGIFLKGRGSLQISLRYEYFSDTGFNIIPSKEHLLSLGFSFLPPEIF
jgi:hypothetical protein